MRFIRDIIAEQRKASPVQDMPGSDEPHAVDAPEAHEAQHAVPDHSDIAPPDQADIQPNDQESVPDAVPTVLTNSQNTIESSLEKAISAELADLSDRPAIADPTDLALSSAPEPEPEPEPETSISAESNTDPEDACDRPTAHPPPMPEPDVTTPQEPPQRPRLLSDPVAAEPAAPLTPPPASEAAPLRANTPSSDPVEVPQPAAGRSAKRSGRVKTRLLGFGGPEENSDDPFQSPDQPTAATQPTYPVGWLIVVDGPGRGAVFTIHDCVSYIGRNADQAVALTFGDTSISRENHAAIAYDDEQRSFFLGHGGKANLVRLNGKPVLSTEELQSEDAIRIGETTLRFVALCGRGFSWSQLPASDGRDVAAE